MTLSPRSIAWTRSILLGLASIATASALFLLEENWRGDRDWQRIEATYAARQEPLAIDALTPTEVPDDRNLFKAPVWADLVTEKTSQKDFERARQNLGLVSLEKVAGIWKNSLNLPEVKQQMIEVGLLPQNDARSPSEAVLAGLNQSRGLLDGLRIAVKERPLASAPVNPAFESNGLRLGMIWSTAKLLAYRAQVELLAGKPVEAYEDNATLLRIAHASELRPATLIQSLVVIAMAGKATDTVATACATHAWSEQQLASLQAQFIDLRPANYMVIALESERARLISVLDAAPRMSRAERKKLHWPWWMLPGWLQENKVALCERRDREIASFKALGTTDFKPRLDRLQQEEALVKQSHSPYRFFPRLLWPNVSGTLRNAGVDLDVTHAAITALALEQWYTTHGHYPQSLDRLVPAYIDVISNQSDGSVPEYRVTGGGTGFELQETPRLDGKPRIWAQTTRR